MLRRLALAALALAACFTGDALLGEPCARDADCGPSLQCAEGGLCGEFRCPATPLALPTFAPDITLIVTYTASMARDTAAGVTRPDSTSSRRTSRIDERVSTLRRRCSPLTCSETSTCRAASGTAGRRTMRHRVPAGGRGYASDAATCAIQRFCPRVSTARER